MPYRIGIDARKLNEPGIGPYVQNLVRNLAELDDENQYTLFVGPLYDGEFDELPTNFTRLPEHSPVYSTRERLALSWRVVRNRLDLYHATHYILPLWLPCRSVTTVHDVIHLLAPDFVPGRLATYFAQTQIRRSLTRSDRVIANCENARRDLVEYFDVDRDEVQTILPGVEAAFEVEPTEADSAVVAELGIERPYVLFAGDSRPHKNEERVLRAFAEARRHGGKDTSLIILGDRELSPERIGQLCSELDIEGSLRWLDAHDERHLPSLLRQAALFLYPTLYEGLPMPVLQAMACGTPIVTSNHATIREIAEGAAKLIEPSSIDSLASAIGWCLQDAGLERTLANDAKERAAEFTWRRVAERTLEVYLDALQGGNGRGNLLGRRSRAS